MELLTAKQVITITTLSRMTIWRYIKAGTFPDCIKLGPKRVAWRRKDIMAWLESRQPVQR
ncbi:AlpA family phage regulatory protein [Cronobacter sakazakii]|uniref:helix-turn-helix transcriptional regulator n=1 Tax=Cronobacter sakazakii TaxID=28141 RepID=UPI000CF11937|nr:AlpA family phage regulatory protein [Cronobacter sakazakii]EIX1656619.1 AlpA family phage regulatory protein [Cronobacter sakazakii]EIX1762584.1 AlpA family phage regulatory protein [Cronobacter sakazakii]EIX6120019.1 AlpA family phage regulatory protein [Cronobacter sakazakii]EIX6208633.1 AlpA family phage regulatory protein [Cronobacter sakazakii]EJQ0793810.1 AlpA family phage regulatory protein [Cronobacter sakazakii]